MDSNGKTVETGEAIEKVAVTCPNCRQAYRLPTRLVGRRLVCRQCRKEFRALEAGSSGINRLSAPVVERSSDSDRSPSGTESSSQTGPRTEAIDTRWAGQSLGRYQVLSILGQGGMGVVWRGHDDRLRRDVALKILNRSKSNSGSIGGISAELFMQEARAVAKLQHPSVVSIFEVAEDQGQVFLALELMEGGTLKEYIDRNGPMKPRDLFEHMIGPAKALALAHDRGIIHRDVKPGNLMFDDHGHLKLMDFGLADVRDEKASERIRGKAVGSLGWIAPETARGKGTTPLSDIYCMGLVMFYALTGKPLVHGKSRSELIGMHRKPPEPQYKSIRGLTAAGERLLRCCLSVDPAQRFQSAHELMEALQYCAAEDPAERSRRRRSHISVAAAAVVIGAFLGIGGVVYYFLDLLDREREARSPVVSRDHAMKFHDDPSADGSAAADATADASKSVGRFASLEDAKVPWPEVPYLVDPANVKFVASTRGKVYHLAGTECGRAIFASNLVRFSTASEAEASGRHLCERCTRQDDDRTSKLASGSEENH